jgi:lytic murein transglycosylase
LVASRFIDFAASGRSASNDDGMLTTLLTSALLSLALEPVPPRCLDTLRASRSGQRISAAAWSQLDGVTVDTTVLRLLDAQPEVRLTFWDYLAVMVDDERVTDGRAAMARNRTTIDSLTARSTVPVNVLAAIWGVESNFGTGIGGYDVLRSLSTLACVGRRQTFFRSELLAALRIIDRGDMTRDRFRGSWAGAFGQTQFMPGSFEWRAVDFDGDGKRNVIENVGDALASSANYLEQAGWVAGLPWGIEVRVPSKPQKGDGKLAAALWSTAGVTRVDGSPLVSGAIARAVPLRLLSPTGPNGPQFLVTKNYDMIRRYNASDRYALAVAHLSDRLGGGGAFVTPWPTDDGGLTRAERRELQQLLRARGHDVGRPTALLTPAIYDAVRKEQERLGQPVNSRPGQKLLNALRTKP